MILNTKRIHNSFWRNFPARAKEMPSKVLFIGKKNGPYAIKTDKKIYLLAYI